MLASHFFDDYTVLSPLLLALGCEKVVEDLFSLLGWRTKGIPTFASKFSPMGSICDLELLHEGEVVFSTTPSRVDVVCTSVKDLVEAGCISSAVARCPRGRVGFSMGQMFSRCGGAAAVPSENDQSNALLALKALAAFLRVAPPRRVKALCQKPHVIFPDGACGPEGRLPKASIGGLMFPADGSSPRYFSERVGNAVMEWLCDGRGAAADHRASGVAANSYVLVFINSGSANFSTVSGFTPAVTPSKILSDLGMAVAEAGSFPWYARVPTGANPSDGPRRVRVGK